jgi:uncharacterized membrane protein
MFEPSQCTPRTIWWAAIIFCIIVVTDSWFRWKTFQYHSFDIAFYLQGMWQALRGEGNVSLLDTSIMGNHAEPIVFLLLPLFWIWKHPMMLVGIQAVLLATMPFTAYRIAAAMDFGHRAALSLALAVLLAPATGFGALHEFHPETLSAPFILLMLEARQRGMAGLHFVWLVLAAMCKENVAGMLAWYCAVHFMLERRRGREWQWSANIVPGSIALGWVLAYALWLGPKWNGGSVDYGGLYGQVFGPDGGVSVAGFFNSFWRGLTEGNLVWLVLVPVIFMPVLRPRWIIIGSPIVFQHLLSVRSSEWQIYWHYGVPLVPLMWFAAAEASARLFWRDAVATYIVVVSVVVQFWDGPVRKVWRTVSDAGNAWETSRVHAALLADIPPDAKVTASLGFLSHVAKREHLQSLQLVSMGAKTLGGGRYLPKPADVVLVDFDDEATFSRLANSFHPAMIIPKTGEVVPASDALLHSWLKSQSLWPVLQRGACARFAKVEPVRSSVPAGNPKRLDDKTQILSIIPAPVAAGDLLNWNITWSFAGERTTILWTKLMLRGADGATHFLQKGPVLPGTELGQFTETWTVPQPNIPHGTYRAFLLIEDPFAGDKKDAIKPVGFEVGTLEVK